MPFRRETYIIAGGFFGAAFFIFLTVIAVDVRVKTIEKSLLIMINSYATPFLDRFMHFITFLGSLYIILSLVLVLCLGLYYKKRRYVAGLYAGAVTSGITLNYLFSYCLQRDRPELWERLVMVTTPGFPSGHTVASSMAFWFLSWIVASELKGNTARVISLFLAIVPFLVGISRLYLGVHWPTDVLGGYALSIAVLAFWLYLYEVRHVRTFN